MAAHAVDVALITLVTICLRADVIRGRIPNAITLPAIGFGLSAAALGPLGVRAAAEGLVAGATVLCIAYALGAVGGGNIKLMAAVGALKGLSFVLTALFCSILVGGLWAVLVLVSTGQGRAVLSDLSGLMRRDDARGMPLRGGALPFSVAIGVGTATTLVLEWRLRL
jgi:prepilin peptidase CpaA